MNTAFSLLSRTRRGPRVRRAMVAALSIGALSACHQPTPTEPESSAVSVLETGFPGQVTAGGHTSGEVMAAAGEFQQQGNDQGTPGIPQGSGGNTGGAELGHTQQGDSSLAGDGQKTAAQSTSDTQAGSSQ